MQDERKIALAVFGSGSGTIAKSIIEKSRELDSPYVVRLVVSSSATAGILTIANGMDVPSKVVASREAREMASQMMDVLAEYGIQAVALAGWLRLIPVEVINKLHGRIVNTHPALLPSFGGSGMYGINVHRAVIDQGATVTGTTVHVVSAQYDEGEILGQREIHVVPGETPEALMERVKALEREYYPEAIATWLKTIFS